MIRFIDLSQEYWTDPEIGHPICAFLCTSIDRFLAIPDTGEHTYSSLEDIELHPQHQRMIALLPPNFFTEPVERHDPIA